jgi:hypothetical protein
MVHAESVMFLAIAVALPVIAVVVFVRSVHDLILAPPHEQFLVGGQGPTARTMTELGVNAAVMVALSVALVLIRRFARLDRA